VEVGEFGENIERDEEIMKCPICGETTAMLFRPFCSERCALIDLAGWFGESFSIATPEFADENEYTEETIESIEGATKGLKRTIH
jgi:uncharacterized protein